LLVVINRSSQLDIRACDGMAPWACKSGLLEKTLSAIVNVTTPRTVPDPV